MTFRVIPNARFGGGVDATGLVPRGALEGTAAAIESMRLTVAARRAPLPVIYGRDRVGGLITRPVVDASGNLLVPVILSAGEIDAVESVEFDDKPAPTGVARTDYLGTSSQAADPWLVAAWAARGVTYTDTLPGIAYTVLRVPQGNQYGFSRLAFTVRGRKVYDPRDPDQTADDPTTWRWSENPALCYADFITNRTFGRGELINWDSVGSSYLLLESGDTILLEDGSGNLNKEAA